MAGSTVKVISYNVDGLCDKLVLRRAGAVCELLEEAMPFDAVLLQEVVPLNEEIFTAFAEDHGLQYFTGRCAGGRKRPYYCAMMLSKDAVVRSTEVTAFPTSGMGRHLIEVVAGVRGHRVSFMTSHLESMKESVAERKAQLAMVQRRIAAAARSCDLVVFGGDTNLRDIEVGALPTGISDGWEAAGKPPGARFTWDTGANKNCDAPFVARCRFDRFYFCGGTRAAGDGEFAHYSSSSGGGGGGGGGADDSDDVIIVDDSSDEESAAKAGSKSSGGASGGAASSSSSSSSASAGRGGSGGGGAAARVPQAWSPLAFELVGTAAVVGAEGSSERMHPSDHFGIQMELAPASAGASVGGAVGPGAKAGRGAAAATAAW